MEHGGMRQGLEWLLREVETSLKEAYDALEAYLGDTSGSSAHQLETCESSIHQVHGSLQLLEYAGPVMLAEEMELLIGGIRENTVANSQEACEVLVEGFLQLPAYLRQLMVSGNDQPETLILLINEIRAVSKRPLITESDFFSPDMNGGVISQVSPRQLNPDTFLELIVKLRQMYQHAVLGVVKGQKVEQNLQYLKKVFARLYDVSLGTTKEPLWKIMLALLASLSDKSIAINMAVRSLLRQMDDEFALLYKGGFGNLQQPASPSLIKNLLFYVAWGKSPEINATEVRRQYALDSALPEVIMREQGEGLSALLNPETAAALVEAVNTELAQIKESLERYVVEGGDAALLENGLALLKRVGDSLVVAGRSEQLAIVERARQELADLLLLPEEQIRHRLKSVADLLVQVETGLYAWLHNGSQSDDGNAMAVDFAQGALVGEIRAGLESVKESVVEFIASQWDMATLAGIPQKLYDASGALGILGQTRAAAIMDACYRFLIEQLTESGDSPDWHKLDSFADALTSIEYYLDFIDREDTNSASGVLVSAEKSVTELGYTLEPQPAELEHSIVAEKSDESPLASEATPEQEQPEPAEDLTLTLEENTASEALASDEQPAPQPEEMPQQVGLQKAAPVAPVQQEQGERDNDIDEEIVEIFLEEAQEVMAEIDSLYPKWMSQPSDFAIAGELRRNFHTLKGSGRMVGAEEIGELAWSVENLLNKMLDRRIGVNPSIIALIDLVKEQLPGMALAFKDGRPFAQGKLVKQLINSADALARGEDALNLQVPVAEPEIAPAAQVSETPQIEEDASPQSDVAKQDAVEVVASQTEEEDDDADEALTAIFAGEASMHLAVLEEFNAEQQQQSPVFDIPQNAVLRALHTLRGSANMAGIAFIADLVTPLEKFFKELGDQQIEIDQDILDLSLDVAANLRDGIAQLNNGVATAANTNLEALLQRLESVRDNTLTNNAQESDRQGSFAALRYFMAEGMQQLQDADVLLAQWLQTDANNSFLENFIKELNLLVCAAENARIEPMLNLAVQLRGVYENIIAKGISPHTAIVEPLLAGHQKLLDQIDCVAASQDVEPVPAQLVEDLCALAVLSAAQTQDMSETPAEHPIETPQETDVEEANASVDSVEPENIVAADETPDLTIEPERVTEDVVVDLDESLEEPAPIVFNFTMRPQPQIEEVDLDEVDRDILETFSLEARELLEEIDNSLSSWRDNFAEGKKDAAAIVSLKRYLHTLKGGARMVGLMQLGELSHELEADILTLEAQTAEGLTGEIFVYLVRQQDALQKAVEAAEKVLRTRPVESASAAQDSDAESAEDAGPLIGEDISDGGAVDLPQLDRQVGAAQEMIRVPTSVLEKLINLSGETSIASGRIEAQISEFSFALEEMDATIRRLQDQVRRIAVETDAQVMFRREQIEASAMVENFDPLEMDRYSQLQQLSRSLLESASDLQDLKDTLINKARDAETQLLEQTRINVDLQEGMMRTRMVPFSRIVPRLRRIVRQVADELGKQIKLHLQNTDGEMDRSVMEQMIAPLEHMIRNAVDHGIEDAQTRKKLGKPVEGSITVSLAREGGDIVIRLADDGRGFNIQAIRENAIKKGLMEKNAKLGDDEIIQFVFAPGFSTSNSVTQVSGRGVGMDVVNHQVRSLGGNIDIDTVKNVGSRFSIRLPFTVSINRALMVEVVEDLYAIPLNSIDGVVGITPAELETYYRYPESRLEYAGQDYEVCYLGNLLSEEINPRVDDTRKSVYLILVHSEKRNFAVQVDELLNNTEIVVKTIGPQFSVVPGLSGATVLGDGRVVVILDLMGLLRTRAAVGERIQVEVGGEHTSAEAAVPTVMVVDDSVTVRKVTGRFLEREGFNVLTAKNGVEAMKLLQDHQPDVMLLDIEMPMMDGFEVASRVKSTGQWREIPIIMITSRTGDKHKERAFSLGVERYLGKPYQEEELLANINELVSAEVVQ